MTAPLEPPERYTSYHHPEKTYSILERAKKYNDDQSSESVLEVEFEYNGVSYSLYFKRSPPQFSGELVGGGPMFKYADPIEGTQGGGWRTLATFRRGDGFDEFIKTYTIEGKTVKWILEHQKAWKYTLDAAHVEQYAGAFTFGFVYRKIPCCIYERITKADAVRFGLQEGYYIGITPGVLYDVTPYAPNTPGAEHWTHEFNRVAANDDLIVELGPYATIGELLDKIAFGKKSLREIFDTEYDDATTLCGWFGV